MSKRFFATLAIMVLGLGLIAGCAKKAPEPAPTQEPSASTPAAPEPAPAPKKEPVTITWMTFTAVPDHVKELDAIIAAFETEHPDINIEVVTAAWGDYWTKLPTMMAGDSAPDTFELNYENFVDYAKKGLLMDTGPLAAADPTFDAGVYYPKAHAAFNYDGKQYGLVETFSTVVLFYNKDMFDAKKVPYPASDWTWEDEIAAAQQLTDAKAGVWGTFQPVHFWEFYKVAAQAGGGVVKDGKPSINTPENVVALQYMVDKILKYKVTPTAQEVGTLGDADLFKQGKVAMLHAGIWNFGGFAEAPFQWDVAIEPSRTREGKANHFFSNGVVISNKSKHPKEAWEWAKFLTASAAATKVRIDAGWEIPALSDPKLVEGYLQQSPPSNRQAVFDALLNPVTPPVIDNFQQMTDELGVELERARLGQASPADALAAAQKKIETLSQ